jgi:hypothetical protein
MRKQKLSQNEHLNFVSGDEKMLHSLSKIFNTLLPSIKVPMAACRTFALSRTPYGARYRDNGVDKVLLPAVCFFLLEKSSRTGKFWENKSGDVSIKFTKKKLQKG